MIRRLALIVSVAPFAMAAALLVPATAHAGNDTWADPCDGYFDESRKWTDGTAPTADDTVLFDEYGTYTVWWDEKTGGRTTRDMYLTDGNVTFGIFDSNSSPYTWTINGWDGAAITGGALTLGVAGHGGQLFLDIGFSLTVDLGGELNVTMGNQVQSMETTVGTFGVGTLTIESGGKVRDGSGYIGYGTGSGGTVTVTGAGSTWANLGDLHVGNRGTSTLTVEAGGRVYVGDVDAAALPWPPSSESAVIVSDASDYGSELFVRNGGVLSNDGWACLGFNAFERGTAKVADACSSWTNGSPLFVGNHGEGELTVETGGSVSNSDCYVARRDASKGDVTVRDEGSTWQSKKDLYLGGTPTEDGGDASVTLTGGARVYVGDIDPATFHPIIPSTESTLVVSDGDNDGGTLVVRNKAVLDNDGWAFLGYNAGETGGVAVTGIDSSWTNDLTLYVGCYGTGTLTIGAGGSVSNLRGYVGRTDTATGTVTVTGGGTWRSNENLYLGGKDTEDGGDASVTVTANGRVYVGDFDSQTVWPPLPSPYDSTVIVSDSIYGTDGGDLVVRHGALLRNDGQVIIGYRSQESGAAIVTGWRSEWTNDGCAYVGYEGGGTLTIEDGGSFSSSSAYVAYGEWSTGRVTVTGQSSTWCSTHDVCLGGTKTENGGDASLTVEAGGRVYVGDVDPNSVTWLPSSGSAVVISDEDTDGGEFLIRHGAVLSSDGLGWLGYNAGEVGTATVTGVGSTWTHSGAIHVGYDGDGTLTVTDGGKVTAATLYASLSDLVGDGTIETHGAVLDTDLVFDSTHGVSQTLSFGAGGRLNLNVDGTGILGAGHQATGTLRIADGLRVESEGGRLGHRTGSSGTATVTGAGSTWTVSGGLEVGYCGSGTLSVEAGGLVSNTSGYIANWSGSTGTATVTGAGSTWTNSGSLCVGYWGAGTLGVEAGGQVSSSSGYLANWSGSTGTATVTGPNSTWTNSLFLYVGDYGAGTLIVEDGGQVSSAYGYIAHSTGSTGRATVAGRNSVWTAGALCVGRDGAGTLAVEAGGHVSNGAGFLGHGSDSTGTATVMGSASAWTNSGDLIVGYEGTGTLTVWDRGKVRSVSGYVGREAASDGEVTVKGQDSIWHISESLYLGGTATYNGGTARLTVQDHGRVHVGDTAPAYLYFVKSAVLTSDDDAQGGALLLRNAASMYCDGYVILGHASGSTGAATVTGEKSTCMSDWLCVGYYGAGTLTVEAGGQVIDGNGCLGERTDSTGKATVTGAGSTWTNLARLFVGNHGAGTLTVEDGGQVRNTDGFLGGLSGSTGEATVTGAGSTWTSSGDLTIGYGGNGTLSVEDGGRVSDADGHVGHGTDSSGTATVSGAGSTWTNSGDLTVGYYGNGTLTVEAGGQVSDTTSLLGNWRDANGTVRAAGAGSTWTSSGDLTIGYDGSGTVAVEDAGRVSSSSAYVAKRFQSIGRITVGGKGSTWQSTGRLYLSGSEVGDGGEASLDVTAGGRVYVGDIDAATVSWPAASSSAVVVSDDDANGGELIVRNAAVLSNDGLALLGYDPGQTGTATVTGLGSTWTNSGRLCVGNHGEGTLIIEDGGQVSNADGILAWYSDGTGAVTVTGTGSTWTNSEDLYVGESGNGTLTIAAGGQVSNDRGHLGYWWGTAGTATVTDAGSTWTSESSLFVGVEGNGTLTVEDGGRVSDADGHVGHGTDSNGTATVTGTGSTWTNSSGLYVGYRGSGALAVEDGGSVLNQWSCVARYSASSGTVTVTGEGSTWQSSEGLTLGGSGAADGGDANVTLTAGGRVYVGDFDAATVSWPPSPVSAVIVSGPYPGVELLVRNAAVLSNDGHTLLGRRGGETGTATVTGAGSSWTNSARLYVGNNGEGTLTIEDGGGVSNSFGHVARYGGSSGTVTVRGQDSTWHSREDLYLGGTGTENGGEATVTLETGGRVYVGDMNPAAFTPNDIDSTDSAVVVSDLATTSGGTLWVRNEAALSNDGYAVLGYESGQAGEATVTGAGSTWTNSSGLYVGYRGSGALAIEDGGSVLDVWSCVATYGASSGTVTVTGAGSTWQSSEELILGGSGAADGGNASVTVKEGGRVYVGNINPDTVTWPAPTSAAVVVSNLDADAGSLVIRNRARLNCDDWTFLGYNTGETGSAAVTGAGSDMHTRAELYVGFNGNGVLTIEDGGNVYSWKGYVARGDTSTGTVTVTGENSTWRCTGSLYLGGTVGYDGGDANMIVEAGGRVYVGDFNPATVSGLPLSQSAVVVSDNDGKYGLLSVRHGAELRMPDGWSYLGYGNDETGTATVTGDGSLWDSGSLLYVGHRGEGTLTIEKGASVSAFRGYVAKANESRGTVAVTDPNSTWRNRGDLYIGGTGSEDGGEATVTVTAGGRILVGDIDPDTAIYPVGPGDSAVVVSDRATTLGGTLTVRHAAVLNNEGGGYLGYSPGQTGTATVTGLGSTWTNSGVLYVGNQGEGTLTIEAGGQVSNADGCIAHDTGSAGTATVTGAGSTWTSSGSLYVGGGRSAAGGTGTLTASNGGTIEVGGALKVFGGGTVKLQSGGRIVTDVFDITDGGVFDFTGGRLSVGTFKGDLHNDGGTLVPGLSAGLTTVEGNYVQAGMPTPGALAVELAGDGNDPTLYDRIVVTGDAALGGALELDWLPVPGDPSSKFGGAYRILTWGHKRDGEFGAVGGKLVAYLNTEVFPDGIEYDDAGGELKVHLHDLLDGDCDLDGRVDRKDLLAVRGGFGSADADWFDGDLTFDGEIDYVDYIAVKRGMGDSVPAGGGMIPEPATLFVMMAAGLPALLKRRRRRS